MLLSVTLHTIYSHDWRRAMKQKYLLAGTVCALAVTIAGCNSHTTRPERAQMISIDAAQTAALKQANIEAENADISSTTIDELAGVTCYKVEFTSGDYTYAYSINAENGEVLEANCRDKNAAPADSTQPDTTASGATTTPVQTTPSTNTNTSTGAVDEAKAQEIALAHAGVKAADATITQSKLDYDDGRQVYELEWYANGAKYDYEIAVATGEIVNSGYEAKTVVGTGNSATVSEATAKQTALARVSGAAASDIYEWKLDYDDGRPEYEGKIIYGGTEYDFTIDAISGTVTEWDAETLNR